MHKVAWYTLEYEEKKNIFSQYEKIFDQDFKEEIHYIKSKENEKDPEPDKEEVNNSTCPEEKDFHNLFKAIAKKTHPDLHGEEYEEVFKSANEDYNNKNWTALISIANDLNIPVPEFNQTTIEMIEKNIQDMEEHMELWQDSIAWSWATWDSESQKENRKHIRKALGIDEEEFEKFLNQK